MEPVFALLNEQQVNAYRLVLDASGIPYSVIWNPRGWAIEIPRTYRPAALEAIRLFLQENAASPPREGPTATHRRKTFSAAYVVLCLIVIHGALKPGFESKVFVEAYGADAAAILHGQLYRCITALLFHADWAHLASNAVGLLIFGTAVAVVAGGGAGWLLIVLCGALGNLITALWYGGGHLSIGASTSVFAAVGLCAAFTFMMHLGRGGSLRRAWLPVAGGVALLGFMGASPDTDLLAHLFGFASGLGVGVLFAWKVPARLPWQVQLAAVLVLVSLVGASWMAGLGA